MAEEGAGLFLPYLFILQKIPLCNLIARHTQTYGIPPDQERYIPTFSFFTDNSTSIAKSPAAATQLYSVAESLCKGSGARLLPAKCIAIPGSQTSDSHPPNGIKVLGFGRSTAVLGIPTGCSRTRDQHIQDIVANATQRRARNGSDERDHPGQSHGGDHDDFIHGVVCSQRTPNKTVGRKLTADCDTQLMHHAADILWGATPKRENTSKEWLHVSKQEGGWGLRLVFETLTARRLGILRALLGQKGTS